MARLDNPVVQYLDASGDPVPGGKLFFFESGTSTPKDTFVDVDLTIKNANPVILDGAGRIPNIFLLRTYKVILKDANDVQIWERDPVGEEPFSAQLGDWDTLTVYEDTDVVRGSDGKYYQSIIDDNEANDPTSSPAAWTQLEWVRVWNINETYNEDDVVRGSDGNLYASIGDGNVGNDPIGSVSDWNTAIQQATEGRAGKTEIANTAEVNAGTDDVRYITPKKLADKIPLMFTGRLNSSGGALSLPSGWSSEKVSTGLYRITHNLDTTGYVVAPNQYTSTDSLADIYKALTILSNTFEITSLTDAGTVIDAQVSFILMLDSQ